MFGDTADPDTRAYVDARKPLDLANSAGIAQAAIYKERQKELFKTVSPPYTVAGKTLTPIDKEFQRMVLARDWNALFTFLPPVLWGQFGMLGKYSFVEQNGVRTFIPFTEDEIRRFVFSPFYTVQPGHVCTDEQRAMGVAALLKAGQTHSAKFAKTDWRSVWPIYPGWGSPGQRFGCEKYVPSTWVKIRKPVVIAAGIVAAVYLGPIVAGKISAMGSGGTSASGIVGAGSKAGAVAASAGGAAGSAVTQASLFTTIKAGSAGLLANVNNARTIKAIVNGEMPPPPIGISGDSFAEWTFGVAKNEAEKEFQRQLTKREEDQMRAEIAAMQRELERTLPGNTPMRPDAGVPGAVQNIMAKEKTTSETINSGLAIAIPLGLAYFLLG